MDLSVLRNAADNSSEYKIKGFASFSESLISDRKFKCDFCGFKSLQYMRLVSLSGVYSELKPQRFKVCCPFCFAVNRLETAKGKGVIAYLPELTQQQVNMITHVIWHYASSKGLSSTQFHYSSDTLNRFLKRTEIVESVLGEKSSDPEYFAYGLKTMSDEKYMNRTKVFSGLRFIPNRSSYINEYEYWSKNGYDSNMGASTKQWSALGVAIKKVLPDVEF